MALNEITVKEDLANVEIITRIGEMMDCIETSELRKLKRTDVGRYRSELAKRFPHLEGRYPQIFKMVMMYERTFDIEKMSWMLGILDKRRTKEVSDQESDNIVSFRQFDENIRDKIDFEKERENIDRAKRGEMDVKKTPDFSMNGNNGNN